ncbi:hypothetical protein [Saccharothrix sp.]|uniref:hypothetical protein n=1 Tax=Saccharothrix sp. TaxID=1873460 RepID=UPI002812209E|nr:hypothetical protein [Saccharothrix sp.]
MRAVTEEGFHVVREALDEQVQAALARRRMSVEHGTPDTDKVELDTVLGVHAAGAADRAGPSAARHRPGIRL